METVLAAKKNDTFATSDVNSVYINRDTNAVDFTNMPKLSCVKAVDVYV